MAFPDITEDNIKELVREEAEDFFDDDGRVMLGRGGKFRPCLRVNPMEMSFLCVISQHNNECVEWAFFLYNSWLC